MSRSATQTVTCPHCGHEQDFMRWDSVNVELNPELRQGILSGALFMFVCGGCGQRVEVAYDMLYHDPVGRRMFWLRTAELMSREDAQAAVRAFGPAREGYAFRIVLDRFALVEKILLVAAGLDDRVMELMKARLWDGLDRGRMPPGTRMLFAGLGMDDEGELRLKMALVNSEASSTFDVLGGSYREFAGKMAGSLPPAEAGKWMVVDQHYARVLLGRQG
jgi:hypothetical protein